MSLKDIIVLVTIGVLAASVTVFLALATIAMYLDIIRPRLEELRKKAPRIIGLRLVVDREPGVKDDYSRQVS